MAISFRKQTMDEDPTEMQEVKKRQKTIGRFVKHTHHTHTTHTAQHTLHNSSTYEEFELARCRMDGQRLYHALQLHTVVAWNEMMESQPVEEGTTRFDWKCLHNPGSCQVLVSWRWMVSVDSACRGCVHWWSSGQCGQNHQQSVSKRWLVVVAPISSGWLLRV